VTLYLVWRLVLLRMMEFDGWNFKTRKGLILNNINPQINLNLVVNPRINLNLVVNPRINLNLLINPWINLNPLINPRINF